MLAIERRKLFLETINANRIATVTALAQLADVTEETVRRDLQFLEKEGFIIKTHGGAILNQDSLNDISSEVRQNMNLTLKTKIAAAAADLIHAGDTILLDASTTALCLARMLKNRKEIRIITNSLHILNELSGQPDIKLVGVCGQFIHRNQSFVGEAAQHFLLDNYCANKLFFSCRGLSVEGGLFESDENEAAVKRTMIGCSMERIMLCDNTKFGRMGNIKLGTLENVSTVITNREEESTWDSLFAENKVQVIRC